VCQSIKKDLSQALAPVKNNDVIFPDVRGLPMEAVVKVLDYKERVEKWLDAVCAHAFEIALSGGQVPGYELANKRANRKWKDEKEVLQTFGEKAVVVKAISPAQLEKLFPDRKEEIEGLTERPNNGQTLKKVGKK
jgi:hypothetical protein